MIGAQLGGLPVVINDYLGNESEFRQVRFPRSKRKRIRKKWSKQIKNWKTFRWQVPVSYIFAGNTLIMNSTAMNQLKEATKLKPVPRGVDWQAIHAEVAAAITKEIMVGLAIPASDFTEDKMNNNFSSAHIDIQRWKAYCRPQ